MKVLLKDCIIDELKDEFKFWCETIESNPSVIWEKEIRENFRLKDVIAHLMMWQKITIARLNACIRKEKPKMPEWYPSINNPEEEKIDRINEIIFELNKDRAFSEIYINWKSGFTKVIDLAEKIPEIDYYDNKKFPWLFGYNVSDVLKGTIVHHKVDHRPDLEKIDFK